MHRVGSGCNPVAVIPKVLTVGEVAALCARLEGRRCTRRQVTYLLIDGGVSGEARRRSNGQTRVFGVLDVAFVRLALRLQAEGVSPMVTRVTLTYLRSDLIRAWKASSALALAVTGVHGSLQPALKPRPAARSPMSRCSRSGAASKPRSTRPPPPAARSGCGAEFPSTPIPRATASLRHHPELQRLGEMIRAQAILAGEIGDRARDLAHAIVAARAERHLLHRRAAARGSAARSVPQCAAISAGVSSAFVVMPSARVTLAPAARAPRRHARAPRRTTRRRRRRRSARRSAPPARRRSDRGDRAAARTAARDSAPARCGVQRHSRVGSVEKPHGHGFIAPTSMKRAGKTAVRAARAIVTRPSSSGWRSTSSTWRLNSSISSRNSTPWCARLTSPGRGCEPPPIKRRRCEIV